MKKLLIFPLLLWGAPIFSQCPAGQVEVSLEVFTDDYGYESYWELIPATNQCGVGTIGSGGNTLVGCGGGGLQNQNPGGYGNNNVYQEGPWCLTEGASYDLFIVDDYADGGTDFNILINGYPVHSNVTGAGDAFGTRYTFTAEAPLTSDLACQVITTPSYQQQGIINLSAIITNRGTDTLHNATFNYSIDGGAVQSMSLSSVSIAPFNTASFTHTTSWNASLPGDFVVRMWASSPNGGADMNAANDTAYAIITVGAPVPDLVDFYLTSTPVKTVIGDFLSDNVDHPRDLDFHPVLSRNELWVVLEGTEASGGYTVKFSNAGQSNQYSSLGHDGNAWHFMSLPTAIAFSENTNFATSPGVFDSNHDGGSPFTGPALWSSDSTIYAQPSGGNGSHLDMLHQSAYSMGICLDHDNAFWLYDGDANEICYYDFKADHGPGNSDHSDGVIRRYNGMGLQCDPNHEIPSHLIYDSQDSTLYIVDTGNDRVLKMLTNTGTFVSNLSPYETVAEYSQWTNSTFGIFADSGLNQPSGIELFKKRILVSEYSTGDIIVYDNSGNTGLEMGRIHTGDPGIMGIKIGPDGKIWYVNALTNEVVRLDGINVGIENKDNFSFHTYPNPAADRLQIVAPGLGQGKVSIKVIDMRGSVCLNEIIPIENNTMTLNVSSLPAGIYSITIGTNAQMSVSKFVKQ